MAHVIMEAEIYHSLLSASWRTRRAGGAIQSQSWAPNIKGTTCVQHSLNGTFCKSKVTQVEKQCFGLFSLLLISAKSTICS